MIAVVTLSSRHNPPPLTVLPERTRWPPRTGAGCRTSRPKSELHVRESPPRVLNPHTLRATCQRTQFYLAFPRTQSPLCAPHACAPQVCFLDVLSSCTFLSIRSPIFLLIPATAVPVELSLMAEAICAHGRQHPPLPRQVSAPISQLARTWLPVPHLSAPL